MPVSTPSNLGKVAANSFDLATDPACSAAVTQRFHTFRGIALPRRALSRKLPRLNGVGLANDLTKCSLPLPAIWGTSWPISLSSRRMLRAPSLFRADAPPLWRNLFDSTGLVSQAPEDRENLLSHRLNEMIAVAPNDLGEDRQLNSPIFAENPLLWWTRLGSTGSASQASEAQ